MSDPSRVRVFRKIIDRQFGKPFYKTAKFKITQITNHTYVTDKGKPYRKNRICLKPNFRYNISAGQNLLGEILQASGSTSRSAVKRSATRSQPVMLEKWPENPSLSNTMVVDLTADSSSVGSSGPNHLQVVRKSTPVEKRLKLQGDSPPVTFANTSVISQQLNMDNATLSPLTASAAQFTGSGPADPRTEFLSPDGVSPEGFVQSLQNALSEPHSSYPSLSLPAQPLVDDSEAVSTSLRG